VTEPGRLHDAILLYWSAGTAVLPDFRGTLRMRIDGTRTWLILDGNYALPGGLLGAIFDVLAGRRITRATAADLLRRFARARRQEILWRKRLVRSRQPAGRVICQWPSRGRGPLIRCRERRASDLFKPGFAGWLRNLAEHSSAIYHIISA
jgi:hypothetical protein